MTTFAINYYNFIQRTKRSIHPEDSTDKLRLKETRFILNQDCQLQQYTKGQLYKNKITNIESKIDVLDYKNADPKQIYKTEPLVFKHLVEEKIYQINYSFIENRQCVERLIRFVRNMEVSKASLRLIKSLVKFYQIPILYFFQEFYLKIQPFFSHLQSLNKVEGQAKVRNSLQKYLQDIGYIYCRLTQQTQKICYLQFYLDYGISQKQTVVKKGRPQYQNKYLKFLSKYLKQMETMLDIKTDVKVKIDFKNKIQNQLIFVIQNEDFYYLQQMTVDSMIRKVQMSIEELCPSLNGIFRNPLPPKENQKKTCNPKQTQKRGLNYLCKTQQNYHDVLPCCRKVFYQDQIIHHTQSQTLEYKNFKFPYDNYCQNKLKAAICGFLNRQGGVILVGIFQGQNKHKEVRGQFLSEYKKEDVLRQFRYICTQIYPDIVGNSRYNVKFVPIKKQGTNQFIAGKYVVRATISPGDSKSMYSYKQNQKELVAFRTTNQVLRRQISQQILLKFKQKLLNPQTFSQFHQKPCPQPQMGLPIKYEVQQKNYGQKQVNKSSKRQLYSNFKKKQLYKQKKQQNPKQQETKQSQQDFALWNYNNKKINKQSEKGNQKKSSNNNKNEFNFCCDTDEQEEKKRKEKLRKKFEELSDGTEQKKQNQDVSLDFIPMNPAKPKAQNKKSSNNMNFNKNDNKTNSHIQVNRTQNFENYIIDQRYHNQNKKPQLKYIQLLIVGCPFTMIKQISQNQKLNLIQQPIQCNDKNATWLKVNLHDTSNLTKLQNLKIELFKIHQAMKLPYNLKIKKIYRNLMFQDEVLLNKLIHMFKHNQQFCDEKDVYYYTCINHLQSIQGYITGLKLNSKTQFISDADLKKRKLQYLNNKK